MGSVLSAASWASCCDCGLAGGCFLCPAPSSSSPSSRAGAIESARTRGTCERCCCCCLCNTAENLSSVLTCLHFAGSFRSRQGR